MKKIDTNLAKIELWLNPFDWLPYLSTYSGKLRILAGAVEAAAGLAFAQIKIIQAILTLNQSHLRGVKEGFNYALHGAANIFRGSVASIPFVHIALFFYDYDFLVGRVNYLEEPLGNFYPIMTAHRLV